MNTDNRGIGRVKLKSFAIFILCGLIGWSICTQVESLRKTKLKNNVRSTTMVYAMALQRQLDQALSSASTLETILVDNDFDLNNFDKISAGLLLSTRGVSCLQLAPNAVITNIHPLAGNEKVMGLDLLKNERSRAVVQNSINTGVMHMAGPFPLIQGGLGIVGRMPVYKKKSLGPSKDNFWGFSTAVIKVADLVDAVGIEKLTNQGYYFSLYQKKKDATDVALYKSAGEPESPVKVSIDIPGGQWYLHVSPQGGWNTHTSLPLNLFIAFFVSILVSAYSYLLFRQPAILAEEVKARTHELTLVNERLNEEVNAKNKSIEAAIEATEVAEKASKAKSEFLATMSHELRTPMNSILILSELVAANKNNKMDMVKAMDFCQRINTSGKHLLNLINDILDFSKIEADKFELLEDDHELDSILASIVKEFEPLCSEKGLKLSLTVDESFPSLVKTDAMAFRQVIYNIISNAVKFTEKGSVDCKCSIEKSEIDNVKISIADTGIGIPKESLDNIFLQFEQADQSVSRKYGGTGLGLAISKRLAKLMGGDLTVESTVGVGSVFTFRVPTKA